MKILGMEKITELIDIVEDAKNIVILTHVDPDGDAIGSCLALYNYLNEYFEYKNISKEINVVLKNQPERFNIIKSFDQIKDEYNGDIDLLIIVDLNNPERLGSYKSLVEKANKILVIDHHIGEPKFADYAIIEEDIASTTLLLSKIFNLLKQEIELPLPSKDVVQAIFIGVLTDTSGFKNTNISKEVFEFVVKAMSYGINVSELYFEILGNKTRNELNLKQLVLNRLEYFEEGRIAISYLLFSDDAYKNRKIGEHEGLSEALRDIDGVDIAFLIREEEEGLKVGIRSKKDFSSKAIAEAFNGGGHFHAAGITTIDKNLEKLKEELIKKAKEILKS